MDCRLSSLLANQETCIALAHEHPMKQRVQRCAGIAVPCLICSGHHSHGHLYVHEILPNSELGALELRPFLDRRSEYVFASEQGCCCVGARLPRGLSFPTSITSSDFVGSVGA